MTRVDLGELGSDVCACGDYRSDHPLNGKCSVCGNSMHPADGCTKFRFAWRASIAEQTHWNKYRGPRMKHPAPERARG